MQALEQGPGEERVAPMVARTQDLRGRGSLLGQCFFFGKDNLCKPGSTPEAKKWMTEPPDASLLKSLKYRGHKITAIAIAMATGMVNSNGND